MCGSVFGHAHATRLSTQKQTPKCFQSTQTFQSTLSEKNLWTLKHIQEEGRITQPAQPDPQLTQVDALAWCCQESLLGSAWTFPVFLIMYMVSMAHWCVKHIVNHRTIGKISCSDKVERYGHEMCILHGPKAMGGILGRIVIVMYRNVIH